MNTKASCPDSIRCYCQDNIHSENFWSKVLKGDGCWIWQGQIGANGYGKQCHSLAHRLAWVFTHGEIDGGLYVLHNCPGGDNPQCVNPSHLWLGTQAANIQDMDRKGRRNKASMPGEANPNALLTDEIVREIRKIYGPPRGKGVRRGVSQAVLAKRFGVSRGYVAHIVLGKCWTHLK